MVIVWDEPKRSSNLKLHGLDFADVEDRFEWETALIKVSHPGEDGRPRFVATSLLEGRLVALVFSLLGTEAISLVSLRPASRSERKLHGAT